MGVTFALVSMVCFSANILITRYALARMPVDAGFFIVLATNILFPALLYPFELAARTSPWAWDWKAAGLFSLGGVIGTFLGRRFLFDAVRMLGPSRASVFHSTAPAFALVGAWLLADERLGLYEIGLMAVVWLGLWFTQPRAGSSAGGNQHSRANVRKGMLAGLLTVAGFGFGSVLRGLAMRSWEEAVLGTVFSFAGAYWYGITGIVVAINQLGVAVTLVATPVDEVLLRRRRPDGRVGARGRRPDRLGAVRSGCCRMRLRPAT